MDKRLFEVAFVAVIAFGYCDAAPGAALELQETRGDYLVTVSPMDVGVGLHVCIAVALSPPTGIWWWQPGSIGCASRSTGPSVFRAVPAIISPPDPSGARELNFRVDVHSPDRPFVEVRLVLEGGSMRPIKSSTKTLLVRWDHLNVPEGE